MKNKRNISRAVKRLTSNLTAFVLMLFLSGQCFSQHNSLSQSDSAYIYKSILFNFQSYVNLKYIQSEMPKLNSGYVFTNYSPVLLDTNEFFPIDLYPIFIKGDSDLILFSFVLNPQKINYQADLYTSMDTKYYCPLMKSGVIAYSKATREIKFVNGYLFLNESYFLLKKLEAAYPSKAEASKVYIQLRFFNHNPNNIIVSPKNIQFFSSTLNQKVTIKKNLSAGESNKKVFSKAKPRSLQDADCPPY